MRTALVPIDDRRDDVAEPEKFRALENGVHREEYHQDVKEQLGIDRDAIGHDGGVCGRRRGCKS